MTIFKERNVYTAWKIALRINKLKCALESLHISDGNAVFISRQSFSLVEHPTVTDLQKQVTFAWFLL